MSIQILTKFFMWCTILNAGFMLLSFVMVTFMGDIAYRIHSKWFPMPRETFNVVIYSFIGLYKILVFVFNIIPWIALTIIG